MVRKDYWLQNVSIDSGYREAEAGRLETIVEQYNVQVVDGRFQSVTQDAVPQDARRIDCQGLLLVPSFTEKHCHLDKTFAGDGWRSSIKSSSVLERSEYEKNIIPKLNTSMEQRAKCLIDTFLANGSTHIRTHIDIYPEAGISHLAPIKGALDAYGDKLSYEIVAFPQHGLLRTGIADLIREALKQGVTLVGGVDPTEVDGDMERSLELTMELATEAGVGIDYHLHERGETGLAAIRKIADLVEREKYRGKVSISHGFAFRDVAGAERDELAQRMIENDITLISHVPITGEAPDLDYYYRKGMKLALGSDNIFDCWSPLGTGDVLDRVYRLSEIFNRRTETELAENFDMVTGYVRPLDKQGNRVWPASEAPADFLLVDACCTAEMLARKKSIKAVFHGGKFVTGDARYQ